MHDRAVVESVREGPAAGSDVERHGNGAPEVVAQQPDSVRDAPEPDGPVARRRSGNGAVQGEVDVIDPVGVAAEGVEVYLPLAGMVDLDQEMTRLRRALEETEQEIRRAEEMLSNENFVSKAPEPVVQRQRDRLAEQQERYQRLEARLAALQG